LLPAHRFAADVFGGGSGGHIAHLLTYAHLPLCEQPAQWHGDSGLPRCGRHRWADAYAQRIVCLIRRFAQWTRQAGWTSAAATLAAYAQTNSIAATRSAKTDANGAAVFGSLSQGIYLITGTSLTIGLHTYYFAPFLAALPNPNQTGGWNYDVTAYPKVTDPTDTKSKLFDINVLLQWSDAGLTSQRPKTVGITLYRNGSVYENYTLSAADNWRHTWKDLDQAYSWSVVQTTSLDTYSVSYQSSGNVLVSTAVIRTAQTPSTTTSTSDGSIPLTGLLWWPIDVLAILGLLRVTLGWRKRFGCKEKNHAA